MKLAIASLVFMGLLVAISGCNSEVSEKNTESSLAEYKEYKKAADLDKVNLMMVATAVDEFVQDSGGCIPATAADLFQPSVSHIAGLGCDTTATPKVQKQYLEPRFIQDASHFLIVKRWDGIYVIETQAHASYGFKKIQCPVIEAKHWKCPQFD
jgi:hypothetical protein